MLFGFVLALILSALSVGVLRRRLMAMEMLDHPGQRRLHQLPVPRGGGLAMIAAAMGVMLFVSATERTGVLLPLNAGLLLVAGIGWWDDRRGLGIGPRLLVHALSAVTVWILLLRMGLLVDTGPVLLICIALSIIASVVASINLHNFIDGANGMLGVQSAFVLATLCFLVQGADALLITAMLCCLGAVLGFLPWNFPVARTFMGDVGSGALGFLLAAFSWWAWASAAISLLEALLLHSLVLIDGLCTLVFRMAAGRRWWQGHREHLYQWLVRSGRSHARVVATVQGWNLIVVLPLIWWMRAARDAGGELVAFDTGLQHRVPAALVFAVFALAIVGWGRVKRRLLIAHRAKWRNENRG